MIDITHLLYMTTILHSVTGKTYEISMYYETYYLFLLCDREKYLNLKPDEVEDLERKLMFRYSNLRRFEGALRTFTIDELRPHAFTAESVAMLTKIAEGERPETSPDAADFIDPAGKV